MADTECGFYRFSVQEMPSGDFIIRATPIGFFEFKGFGSIGFQLAEGTTREEANRVADLMNNSVTSLRLEQ
jgi:hypothetical protein